MLQGICYIFCVLTDENEKQSLDRSGGKHGNKGVECAISCLKMIELKTRISSPDKKIGFQVFKILSISGLKYNSDFKTFPSSL